MPKYDKTGPKGKGPMTGRMRGKCLSKGKNLGWFAKKLPKIK